MPERVGNETEAETPLLSGSREAEYGATNGPHDSTAPGISTFSRNLGTVEAFAILISIVIGSGIFTSPGSIDANVPSPGIALVIWLVGGILAWTGASTLAELGTAIPGEGGVQPYLKHIFGDIFGFLAAWTWIVAVMPATLAILSIVFIESIYTAKGVTDQAGRIEHKLLSILVLVIINAANGISTKASTQLNNFFVMIKFTSILGVVVAGIVVLILTASNPDSDIGGRDWATKPWFGSRNANGINWEDVTNWEMLGYYSTALYGALWAYSGWDKAIYINAELSAPARQLPLAINTAIPTIILCFIAANTAYYILLPWDMIAVTDSVAVTAITRVMGPAFGIVAAILVCLVVAGSLLGNSFVAGRMTVAAAKMNWLPQLFALVGRIGRSSNKSTDSDAPLNALILSSVLSAMYILFGSFRALLTFNGLGEYSFFFLTVVGAVVLRYREPELHRPYKPVLFIPIVFAIVSGFVVIRGAIFAPIQGAILVVVWIIGVGFYQARKLLGGRLE